MHQARNALYISNSNMKKFIRNIVIYFTLLTIVFGGWAGTMLWMEVKSYKEDCVMPDGVDMVVIGDSQSAHGIDPELWPGLFNFGCDATALDQCYMKLKDLYSRNPGRIKTVILDVSMIKYLNADGGYERLINTGAYHPQFLLHWLHLDDNVRALEDTIPAFRDIFFKARAKSMWRVIRGKQKWFNLMGGRYSPMRGEVSSERAHLIADQLAAEMNAGNGDLASAANWIIKIADFVNRNNSRFVIISTPLHKMLTCQLKVEAIDIFHTHMRALSQQCNALYLDFTDMPLPEGCWYDAHHLSEAGAKMFTPVCRDAVCEAINKASERD